MVDKWPKFLKSTPGFPRELKMGIFAASEKGEIFGGSKLGQFWQGEGGTLEPEAGNTLIYWQICLPCKFWWLDQYWQWWEKIWTVKIWNKACMLENQSKMFPPAFACWQMWKVLTNESTTLQRESPSQIWQFAIAVTAGILLLLQYILSQLKAIFGHWFCPHRRILHWVKLFSVVHFDVTAPSKCLPRGFSPNRLSSSQCSS